MLKKICVIGSSGYVGSHLVTYLHFKKIRTISETVPRPKSKKNIEDFYENYISKVIKKNSKIDLFINCAGSISCKKYEDFYFNSNFDVIFQKILKKKGNKIKYISLNSTKVFTNNLDDYAVSKRLLHKNFICSKYFKSIYIDLIFDRNSQHFIKIQKIIRNILFFPIPIFFPGKIFYPINCDKLVKKIYEISTSNEKFNKYLILGKKKFYFYELILKVMNISKLNSKIFFIKSSFIKRLPKFIINFILKSKFLQQFDDTNFLKKNNFKDYKIVSINFSI